MEMSIQTIEAKTSDMKMKKCTTGSSAAGRVGKSKRAGYSSHVLEVSVVQG